MTSSAKAMTLRVIMTVVLGAWGAPESRADSFYTLRSLNAPIADFVTTGDAVQINVTAASTAAIQRAGLTLNGHDVTGALRPDGTPGSMTGLVPGLQVGVNTLRLYKKKGSQDMVGELAVIRAARPIMACGALANVGLPDTVITSTVLNADGATSASGVPLPEHCVVRGTIEPRTGIPDNRAYGTMFELRVPTSWNGRFFFQGQGGTGGSVAAATGQSQLPPGNSPPLAAGWAVVSFDGGHEGGDVLFGLDPKAKTDFAYHSMDVAAVTAKALISDYYGQGTPPLLLRRLLQRRPSGDDVLAAVPHVLRRHHRRLLRRIASRYRTSTRPGAFSS